jgi:hypothetical protein
MTHHDGTEHSHDDDHAKNEHTKNDDAPVGGTLGTTGTEGIGMPEQVVGDQLHTDERAQTAEESVSRGTVGGQLAGGQVAGGLGTAGLGEDQLGGGLSPNSTGVPGDQVTSTGGVSADPLDGSNATGGYGDESTGFSDGVGDQPEAQLDRDPGEDATTVNRGNSDR